MLKFNNKSCQFLKKRYIFAPRNFREIIKLMTLKEDNRFRGVA